MLDPAYVRDHLEAVRAGLRSRGLDPDKALEEIATLETARRRIIPELEGLKRLQNTSGDEIARAKRQGKDTTPIQEANRARAQQIKQLGIQLDSIEHQREVAAADAAEPAPCHGADRQECGRQPRGAPPRRAAGVRLRPEGALGPRSRARHPRFRTRRQDRRGALHRAHRRRRPARAGADQLHARPAHARARLSRGGAALPDQQRLARRHRQPSKVRGGSLQSGGRLGPLPRSHRRGAADEHAPRRNPRRPRVCRFPTRRTHPASAAKRVRTARTSAA